MACHLLLVMPLVIAGLFVFLPWTAALPLAATLAVGTVAIAYPVLRAHLGPVVTGREALVGAAGQAVSDLDPDGLVKIRSELWVAEAPTPIGRGTPVEVLDVRGARVQVRELRPR
ncbi:MAG: hypothetical protein HY359_17590 [Candidatus Rokubacteria bacterium]|nr:hypothetical protein [Candidatus Rokubacteria bacterium]